MVLSKVLSRATANVTVVMSDVLELLVGVLTPGPWLVLGRLKVNGRSGGEISSPGVAPCPLSSPCTTLDTASEQVAHLFRPVEKNEVVALFLHSSLFQQLC